MATNTRFSTEIADFEVKIFFSIGKFLFTNKNV